ncbi:MULTISPECIES: PspC domain-containing protein [Tissierellales]|jgi:phage shock protein PspC (stress-responsive transcriptional regulator)|uniref:PspC domain-containing protein n=1 Tax=Acidilutibacter cellobiosedens TaxID=2507161 RepID=A0A410QE72_9FIRM|nr:MULTISPECIES: PspC domain-containing protein [Tissierellales]QAT62323.1 PspC domain-containing protein [Acidilutibacter cellobiosedens]SCL92095.1 DNA-binding transcriptional activator PspC [Sporanaerobacter sp. PP17-6a]
MARKIYRSKDNKIISGVCGGLGEYFNVDPSIMRLLWIILAFVTAGFAIIAYFICALVIPQGDSDVIYYGDDDDNTFKNNSSFIGIVLIIFGSFMLIKKLFPWFTAKWFNIGRYWPILLIIAGIYIIYTQRKQ